MHNENLWELPFGESPTLELETEFGSVSMQPVESGRAPRVELSGGGCENVAVDIDRLGDVVRVSLDPQRGFGWFGHGWHCRAAVYVPRNVRAALRTSAGTVSVRDLEGCELAIKANAGKIDLDNVYGLIRLEADAGGINARRVGGSFDVETHAGSVRMEILDLQPGEHRLRASMGSVRLELARGLEVAIETHTAMGSVRNNYPVNQRASTRLLVSTEMGSVRVEEAAGFARSPRPPAASASSSSSSDLDLGLDLPVDADVDGPRTPVSRQDPELERILKMVEAGELSAQDADELLRAMGRV